MKKRLAVDLPSDLHERLHVAAAAADVHTSQLIRAWVRAWLDQVELDPTTAGTVPALAPPPPASSGKPR